MTFLSEVKRVQSKKPWNNVILSKFPMLYLCDDTYYIKIYQDDSNNNSIIVGVISTIDDKLLGSYKVNKNIYEISVLINEIKNGLLA